MGDSPGEVRDLWWGWLTLEDDLGAGLLQPESHPAFDCAERDVEALRDLGVRQPPK